MNDTELIRQLRNALCCARGYMSDAIENESPCAKKDGGLVDDAIAKANARLAKQSSVLTELADEIEETYPNTDASNLRRLAQTLTT